MLHQSSNRSVASNRWRALYKFYQKRPLAFWGSLLVVLLAIAYLAVNGLFSPNSVEPEVLPVPSPIPAEPAAPRDGVPIWLFGAIALSCAIGCGLIILSFRLHQIQQRQYRRRVAKKSGRSHSVPAGRKPTGKLREIFADEIVESPYPQTDLFPIAQQPPATAEVTVLPPETKHHLDGNQESLADLLDLRKRQSLASLLRQNFNP